MASSEVENVVSTPVGCVLRNHNGREYRFRKKNNAQACIQQNLKDLVHSCFSASPENAADSIMSQSQGNKTDKWAKAREVVFDKEPSRGVSSLVQKWRVFEAESKSSNSNNNHVYSSSCSSRSNSGFSNFTENLQFLDGQIKSLCVTESVEEKSDAPSMTEESSLDSESVRMGPSRDSNSTEKERMRVSDIIKKLKCGEVSNEQLVANFSLPKVRTSIDHLAPDIRGHGVIPAAPRIRGRRAFNDLITQLERDRHQEVQRLGERKAVSKCSHRGRLQAMLKVKMILHEKEIKDGEQINLLVSDRRKHSKGSSVMHLRERFNTGLEQNAVSTSPRKEMMNDTHDLDKFSSSNQLTEVADHTPDVKNPSTSGQLKEVADNTPSVDNPSIPDVDNPSTSVQLKEMVDHTSSAASATTSTQHKEEINLPEVTHPESPRQMVIDVNSNSTCNNIEDDINVVCPTPRSLKDIINSWEQTHLRSLHMNQDVANDTLEVMAWSTSDRVKIDISSHDVITPQQNTLELHNTETPCKEVAPNLDVLWQDTAFDTRSFKSQKSVDNVTSPDEWKDRNEAEEKVDDEQLIVSLPELVEDNQVLKIDWEEQPDRGKAVETFPDWKSNFSQELSEWEEDQSYQNMEESTLDWIYDVCRPRSDWECLRQERYQEMLDPFADNGDIKHLLERKNVSNFLSSGLRNKIDQLMISRTQGQPLVTNDQVEQVKQEEEVVKEEGNDAHNDNDQEGGVECYPEGEEEDESPEGRQHSEVDEFSNQTPSMTSASADMFGPWCDNQDNNVSDDHVASPSLQQYSSFNSPNLENQQFSSLRSDHPSIEMELIFDLRGHMEQLHKEIFDLRKSLHTCMEMQMKLQHSMMREAESDKSHSTQNRGSGSIDRISRKGTCCLCFDAEVDSLLYRCGHMCTCYKCAQELHQHSGICPLCQAPILDVVRTYTN